MILIPKYEDRTIHTTSNVSMGGRYKMTKGINDGYYDADLGLYLKGNDIITGGVDWFDNIITNYGLNAINNATVQTLADNCHVGEGTTPAVVGDTSLETWVAGTVGQGAGATKAAFGPTPYYNNYIQTKRFGEGVAEGNISEVGMNNNYQSNTNMYSRALVSDGAGGTTTVPVLSTEWLDIVYEHRIYHDLTTADATGSVLFSGVSYDYIMRCAWSGSYQSYWDASDCRAILIRASGLYGLRGGGTGTTLGAVTAGISNNGYDGCDTIGGGTYSAGTYTRDSYMTYGLNDGNFTGGLKAYDFFSGQGSHQIIWDPILPKNTSSVMTINHRIAWARATI